MPQLPPLVLEAFFAVVDARLALRPLQLARFAIANEGVQQIVARPGALADELDEAYQAIEHHPLHHMLHAAGGGFGRCGGNPEHLGQKVANDFVATADLPGYGGPLGGQRNKTVRGIVDQALFSSRDYKSKQWCDLQPRVHCGCNGSMQKVPDLCTQGHEFDPCHGCRTHGVDKIPSTTATPLPRVMGSWLQAVMVIVECLT